jgi:hypothetical protein
MAGTLKGYLGSARLGLKAVVVVIVSVSAAPAAQAQNQIKAVI